MGDGGEVLHSWMGGGGVDDAMVRAGVADLAGRPIGRLSKGQRRRVGLAQALLGSPRAYVLDEPTIGLDPAQIVDTRRVIRGLRERAAVLLSTHVLAEAAEIERTADFVFALYQSRDDKIVGEAAWQTLKARRVVPKDWDLAFRLEVGDIRVRGERVKEAA